MVPNRGHWVKGSKDRLSPPLLLALLAALVEESQCSPLASLGQGPREET